MNWSVEFFPPQPRWSTRWVLLHFCSALLALSVWEAVIDQVAVPICSERPRVAGRWWEKAVVIVTKETVSTALCAVFFPWAQLMSRSCCTGLTVHTCILLTCGAAINKSCMRRIIQTATVLLSPLELHYKTHSHCGFICCLFDLLTDCT